MNSKDNITKRENITVEYFFDHTKDKFKIKLLTQPKGFNRIITDQNLHRPGLALAGFVDLFSFNRVQVFGNTEMQYLGKLTGDQRRDSLQKIFEFEIPCIVITDNGKAYPEILELADKYEISIFGTEYSTTKAVYFLTDFLDDQFAPKISVHGSFVDVYGVGLLITGKSGIGKSEVALDLVERGHRLVADDLVILTKKGEGIIIGAGTDLVKHFMEIRGIGIIDVKSMFGVRAIRYHKRLEILIELEVWDDQADYTRTGLEYSTKPVLDVETPYMKVPIVPGKNITVICEVIALNYLLKHYKYDAAKIFQKKLSDKIQKKSKNIDRAIDYFEHDFE